MSSKRGLTRQELGWLLTQEAAGAADRLRSGVQVLRTGAPPPPVSDSQSSQPGVEIHVEASLNALDDVMRMLSSLHQRPSSQVKGRRGRIDLASLLWEVAPEARVSIEPGHGTEVFGDEGELRRMLHVLVGHGSGLGSQVTIRRDGDDVRVAVVLGPDSSATAETERAWLSRMATRYGGRHDLEGGTELLSLPADGVSERNEREALRKELNEARAQGEAYARELAAVFERGTEEESHPSTFPPAGVAGRADNRFATIAQFAGGIAAELRNMLSPVGRELHAMRGSIRPGEIVDERVEGIRRRLLQVQDFVGGLASIGELEPNELPAEIDLIEIGRTAIRALMPRAERGEVKLKLAIEPDAPDTRAYVRGAPRATAVLVRELISQAVAATPHGADVLVTIAVGDAARPGTRIVVDDAGAPLPSGARRPFLSLELDPGTYGRPSSIPLYVCAEISSYQGASLELADAPTGGLRVSVTFPR